MWVNVPKATEKVKGSLITPDLAGESSFLTSIQCKSNPVTTVCTNVVKLQTGKDKLEFVIVLLSCASLANSNRSVLKRQEVAAHG